MSARKYYLGVDGGASKTSALLIDQDATQLGHGLAGPSNHLRIGLETATRNIERAVNIALVEAGMAIREVEYAYCGIAGADHPAHRQRVIESLKIFFPHGNFIVDNDARIALTGAIGFGSGVGWLLAILAMAGIRQRLDESRVPEGLRGPGITLIIAGLMALAFIGFTGVLST